MRLHENKALFSDAIQAAAQKFQIPEIYVEKDYWVTLGLERIFSSPFASDAVFKGGTALSKCHQIIQRFSEDIDMVALRRQGDSDSRMAAKLKSFSTAIIADMHEVHLVGVTNKKGMIRKTAHEFPKMGFTGVYGQVRPQIILESTWLGRPEPYERKTVSSYINDMMESSTQEDIQDEYEMHPFFVQVQTVERTFCEKVMSLVRFSFTEAPYVDLAKKIRHVYDLNRMLTRNNIESFLNGPEFDIMLNMVGTDDITSFKNNILWLENHPSTAIIFSKPAESWEMISSAYHGSFSDMVTVHLPTDTEMVETLSVIAERLGAINWTVQLEEN